MEPKYRVQMASVISIGTMGVSAVIFSGLASLNGQAEPTWLVAVVSGSMAYLAGFMHGKNGGSSSPK